MDEPDTLIQLDPAYKTMLRVQFGLLTIVLLAAATGAELLIPGWTGAVWLPVALFAGWLLIRMPMRRYAARGYSLAGQRLRVVRGILFRSDTVVPFGRVQHIDVNQGPLERAFHLATLTVHTAGSHNASVSLPGLAHEDALAMREEIRAAIRHRAQ